MSNNLIEYERIYENFSIRDMESEYSLINLTPTVLREAIKSLPEHMLGLSEQELTEIITVDATLRKLRTSFWLEYVRAVRTDTAMLLPNVYGGICSQAQFTKMISNNNKLVYIITPRPQYNVELEDLLFLGIEKVRQTLEADAFRKVTRKNPETQEYETYLIADTKLLALQNKIFNDLSDRRRGQVAQKIDIKQHTLAHHTHELPRTVKDVEIEMQKLEALQPQSLEAPIEKEKVIQTQEEDPGEMP